MSDTNNQTIFTKEERQAAQILIAIGLEAVAPQWFNGATSLIVQQIVDEQAEGENRAGSSIHPPSANARTNTRRKRRGTPHLRNAFNFSPLALPMRETSAVEDLDSAFAKMLAGGNTRKEARALINPRIKKLPEKRKTEPASRGPKGAQKYPPEILEAAANKFRADRRTWGSSGALPGRAAEPLQAPPGYWWNLTKTFFPDASRADAKRFRRAVHNYLRKRK